VVVPEPDIERVGAVVGDLLADDERRGAMAEAMRAAAMPDAADMIAEELIALARR
jgi:UDP-N-acetylglucosamine:LPS N-acetylglucosamine transferase